jgi:phenylacetate-CoA ligase
VTAPGFLLSRRLRRHYVDATSRQQSLADANDADWAAFQLRALQRVWADAVVDVPYYSRLAAENRAPRRIQTWQDVAALPVLTRHELQEHPEQFIRLSRRPHNFMRTAGSTGSPLKLGMEQAERDLMRVVKIASWADFGYTPSSRMFLMWGHSHLLGTGTRGRLNHLKRKLADRMLGYRRVDAYRLSPEICEQYAEALIAFQPFAFISYAAALDVFARYTAAYRDHFRSLGLKFVLATAEPVPRPDTRTRLEDLFNCPVVEEYGGAEFGQVAFSHGRGIFEVFSDLNLVETLPANDDDIGNPALITSLYDRYVPLIRYRVGDALVGSEHLPHGHVRRFAAVAGRINDAVFLNDGTAIHSVAFFHCIHQEDQVLAIQLMVADDGIDILLVTRGELREAMEARIRNRLRQLHPQLAASRFRYVDDLATTRAGKRRWFIDNRMAASRA